MAAVLKGMGRPAQNRRLQASRGPGTQLRSAPSLAGSEIEMPGSFSGQDLPSLDDILAGRSFSRGRKIALFHSLIANKLLESPARSHTTGNAHAPVGYADGSSRAKDSASKCFRNDCIPRAKQCEI
jgi:hypothetical protein